ncbi:VOC family protein [Shewanella waksmanii]|uniref:VOC family protein n=1 Tax=Shewanella waksmanii TaxID=213783 RepID=UPI0037367443
MLAHAPLVWGEIPVADMDRATAFYQRHFDVQFKYQHNDDMQMAIIETEDPQAASIGLIKHPMMQPSSQGSVVYLHLSPQLTPLVDKLVQAEVKIVLPVMPINDGECGYVALFVDSEGNTVGLWSAQQ